MSEDSCFACEGTGRIPCGLCQGSGKVGGFLGIGASRCDLCSGEGNDVCPTCGGKGTAPKLRRKPKPRRPKPSVEPPTKPADGHPVVRRVSATPAKIHCQLCAEPAELMSVAGSDYAFCSEDCRSKFGSLLTMLFIGSAPGFRGRCRACGVEYEITTASTSQSLRCPNCSAKNI